MRLKAGVCVTELKKKGLVLGGRTRDFKQAISGRRQLNLIAEIKPASPAGGILRADFNPVEIAQAYQNAGAVALSVLTDQKFFRGDIDYLRLVRAAVRLPLLRKDFIIDEYQIYQSLYCGADAVLLIAQLLSAKKLMRFLQLCGEIELEAVCEVHTAEDLDKVLSVDPAIIGINHRNLKSGKVDLRRSAELIKKIPKNKIVISESGIKNHADVQYLRGLGINAVLIGEAFMRCPDIPVKVKEIMGFSDGQD